MTSESVADRVRRPLWRAPFSSFRSQVALGFGSIAAVLAVALSLVLGSMFAQKSQADEAAVLSTIARTAAKALGDGLSSRTREIEVLAGSTALWNEGLDSEDVVQALARTQALTPYSAWIGAVSSDGVVQASTGKLLLGVNVAERPWFQEGRRGTHVGDVHAAKLLAALLPRGSDGGPQRFVDFAAPIVRGGQVLGVLGMHGSWEWTRATVESLFPDDALSRELEVFVIDRNSEVIYASQASVMPEASLRAPGTPTSAKFVRGSDGDEYLLASAPVPPALGRIDLGWTVIAREPATVARAAARAGIQRALWLGMLAALVACAIGWLVAGRLTRSLRQIAAVADEIGNGGTDVRMPTRAGSSEVKQLSAALAGMTARLTGANAKLEQRVKERTSALELANAELDRQARFDALTGLLNRYGMDERLRQVLHPPMSRATEPLGVLMIDIDHFKRVNDSFGHAIGDQALRSVAALLQTRLRKTDMAARLGGEEFVVLLPATPLADAARMAGELVRLVADTPMDGIGRLTISCGVTRMTPGDEDIANAIQRADKALYAAKSNGRNRVELIE